MKHIFFGIALMAIPFLAFSQWIKVPAPTANGIADIKFTDSLHGYAAGYEHILQSNDGGYNWQITLTQSSLIIADLSFPEPNTGYVVGDNGFLMKTTDAGNTWVTLNSPSYENLRGVYFLNPDTGFICGQSEKIYRTEDGGITWMEQNTGIYWLRQFSFPTPQIGYSVGDGFSIYKTFNGGLSWNWLTGGSTPNLADVVFLTPDTGYVCGYGGLIIKTVNGGLNWQTLYSGVNNDFSGIWFFNTREGYVVGTDGLIMKTTDGGQTWTNEESGTNSFLRTAFFFSQENGFICGMDGTILRKIGCMPHADFDFNILYFTANFNEKSDCANKFWWSFGDDFYSDLENPCHIYNAPGIYEVCLTAVDSVSMANDSVCQTIVVPFVGIAEKKQVFSIYPNPCSGRIYLENHTSIPIERIEIFNSKGEKVFVMQIDKEKAEIKINLPDGLYVVKGYTPDQGFMLKRLIVLR